MKKFHGVWPAVLTPVTPEGKPALDVLEQLVNLFVQQGLDGLYLTGSTGQWPLFSLEERRALLECAVQASAGRIPIMAHIGAVTTADAVELARHASRVGADAVSSVTPIYYSHSPDVVFEYYRQIGLASDLPLFAYHLSSVSKMALGPREYADRLLRIPNIRGMKITDVDLYTFGQIHNRAGDRLHLFSGADEVMCHAILSGACGAIGTFYNLWGPACQQARVAFARGDVDRGRAFMLRFQDAIARVIASGSIWAFLRQAMRRKYGIDVGMPRPPLGSVDPPWEEAEVDRLINLVDQA